MRTSWLARLGPAVVLACSLATAQLPNAVAQPKDAPATVAYVPGNDIPTFDGGSAQTVLGYSISSPEPTSPISTLTLPLSCNSLGPVAMDSSGQLYAGCFSTSTPPLVQIFSKGATGSATPSRTIEMSSASYEIAALALDASGKLYVASLENSSETRFAIRIFSADANGPAAPLRTVKLPGNEQLVDLAGDGEGNIYAAGTPIDHKGGPSSFVDVYSTQSGERQRRITLSNYIYGVAVDAAMDVYATVCPDPTTCSIEEFAPGAKGTAPPINVVNLEQGGAEVGSGPVRIDATGNVFTPLTTGSLATSYGFTLYDLWQATSTSPITIVQTGSYEYYHSFFALN